MYSSYFRRLLPYKKSVIIISILILIASVSDILIPLVFGQAILVLAQTPPDPQTILLLGIAYVLLSLLMWICFSLRTWEVGNFTPFFLEKLRLDIFDNLEKQDMSFYDHHLTGGLNSRISNDAMDFASTTLLISDNLGNVLVSVVTFGILLALNPMLAIITLVGIPLLFIVMFSLRRLAKIVSQRYRQVIGDINSAMVESIEGIQVSKSFGQEASISEQFNVTNRTYFRTAFRMTVVTHVWRSLLETITAVILIIVLYIGNQLTIQGITTTATIVMFILYIQRFFRPISSLATFFPELSAGMAAYERILAILDAKSSVQQVNAALVNKETLAGDIVFQNVNFSYQNGEDVLHNFSLSIHKNEKIAIVGHTGAGKSSLIKVLTRNYEFQQGKITINDQDIRTFDLASYRRSLGIVPQDIFLFAGTIEENIRYGRPDVSKEELWNAIQTVNLDEVLEYLPNGLSTVIGERGRGLSVGQKQLICFARALVVDPQIVILDEATASIDAYTEALIQEGLRRLLSQRTAIIIAHRLSTILDADRIIVMDKGQIIEEGSHTSLLAQGGHYKQLYKQYYEHQNLE